MTLPIILYFLSCCVVGLLSQSRRIGFWGGFFGSMVMSPLGGIFLAIALGPAERAPRR